MGWVLLYVPKLSYNFKVFLCLQNTFLFSKQFKCCGVDGNATVAIATYSMSEWFKGSGGEKVPDSCCKNNDVANRDACVSGSDTTLIYDMVCMSGSLLLYT